MHRSSRRWPMTLAATTMAAALVVGCATADDGMQAEIEQLRQDVATDRANTTEVLEERLDRRERAEEELIARIDDLEERLGAALEADETTERLDEVDADIGSLDADIGSVVDALTVLEEDLAVERSARETLDANTGAATQELRDSVAELRGSINNLRGEIALATDAVIALRDRLDALERSP